ncbi:M15 family metallopeptidase [Andreprevotia chitinilytica]|uniref:M15 family metallopeptidase n=1 Tax=Andreprevotia chitinilytica TaxID=396808 RepID=UPI000AC372BD|nr:M15 family metallopeptidase [Andreprevotia chitinilytica]
MLVVLGVMFLLLASLAWVGWRFFYAGPDSRADAEPREVNGAALVLQPAAVRTDSAPIPLEKAPRRKLDFTWPSLLRRRWWLYPVLVLLTTLTIVMTTLHLAGFHVLGAFIQQPDARNDHIQLALTEEKLVPPPPLPPSIFITSERPSLAGADRDWSKLDQPFAQVMLRVMAKMEARGFSLALLEGYRSPERQDMLAEGHQVVTKAHAYQSKHQFGLAVDLAPMRDGHIVLSERDPWAFEAYQTLGEEAEAAGLTWGGRWGFKDYGHIESKAPIAALRKAAVQQDL